MTCDVQVTEAVCVTFMCAMLDILRELVDDEQPYMAPTTVVDALECYKLQCARIRSTCAVVEDHLIHVTYTRLIAVGMVADRWAYSREKRQVDEVMIMMALYVDRYALAVSTHLHQFFV